MVATENFIFSPLSISACHWISTVPPLWWCFPLSLRKFAPSLTVTTGLVYYHNAWLLWCSWHSHKKDNCITSQGFKSGLLLGWREFISSLLPSLASSDITLALSAFSWLWWLSPSSSLARKSRVSSPIVGNEFCAGVLVTVFVISFLYLDAPFWHQEVGTL